MSDYTSLLEHIQKDLKRLEALAKDDKEKMRKALAARIKLYRTKHNLTLEDLAKKMYVSKMAVIRWEKGEVTPNDSTLARLRELKIIDADS